MVLIINPYCPEERLVDCDRYDSSEEDVNMTLPTFLGIGVQLGGSTWLHTLLASHPDVYMPTIRKEIRFFDQYYDNGLAWYESFFCSPEDAIKYQAIGEISPEYYLCEDCPERIFKTFSQVKLIMMLRHPVSRAYSQYGFTVQRRNYRGSFEEFLAARPSALEKGFYSRYLKRYFQFFDRKQFLPLLFEDVFTDLPKTKNTIGDFLGISSEKFPELDRNEKVNASTVPTHRSLYDFVVKTGRRLRKKNLEPLVDFVMRLGIQRFLSKGEPLQPLDKELKKKLSEAYYDEFDELEKCLQIDLSSWRIEKPLKERKP